LYGTDTLVREKRAVNRAAVAKQENNTKTNRTPNACGQECPCHTKNLARYFGG